MAKVISPSFSSLEMRIVMVLFLAAVPALAAGWHPFHGPGGVSLCLPPGSEIFSQGEGAVRIQLPVSPGTLLSELFIDIELGTGALPPGKTVWFRCRRFSFSHREEGAAGSRYESFRYATPLGEGRWVSLTFVIRSAIPGAFPSPPPPYDRRAVLRLFCRILASLRIAG